MPKIAYIRFTERVVGEGHPSREDVLNRPVKQLLTIAGWDPDANDVKLHHFPLGVYADDVYARTGATQTVHPAVHMLSGLDVDGDTHLVGRLDVDGDASFTGWMENFQVGLANDVANTYLVGNTQTHNGPVGTLLLGKWGAIGDRRIVDITLAQNSIFDSHVDSLMNLGNVNFKANNVGVGAPAPETLKWWYKPHTIDGWPLFERRQDDGLHYFILGENGGGIKSGAYPEGDIVSWHIEVIGSVNQNFCDWRTPIDFHSYVTLAGNDLTTRGAGGTDARRTLVKCYEAGGWTAWTGGAARNINTVATLAELQEVVGNLIKDLSTHHGLLSPL